jgi:Flp pilus assembly protein CpaB
MTYRVKNITIAVALALVAALLTSFYVTNYQRNVRADESNVTVYVAARDIPAGTPGSEIAAKGMLEKSEIVRRSVVPGAISNPKQVGDLVSTQPIYAGEQISSRRFASPSERGIEAQLTGVQRAIALPGDEHQLLAGTLRSGDRVDVVATFEAGGNTKVTFTRIVLRDIEVLRAPGGAATTEKLTSGTADGAYAVMLKVTDTQVQKLHWVSTAALEWHLELRPGRDAADSPENIESWHSILRDGARPRQLEEAGVTSITSLGSTSDE